MYGFVYITTNNINGKKYIGQKKYDKENRWVDYLGSGVALNKAIAKYGRENFSKIIIEHCETKEKLNEREIFWINFYDAINDKGFYNIASGGDGGNTISGYTKEQKEMLSSKLSAARKGIVNIGGKNGSARRVICLNTMKVFDSIREAADFYNIDKDAIQQCCSDCGHRKTAGELNGERMIWDYYDETKNYTYSPFKKNYRYKPILCLDSGVTYDTVHEASRDTGCSVVGIRHCCSGFLKTTKGMRFAYA